MTTLIHQATIVNEGEQYVGSVLIKDNHIACIIRGNDITGITADHIIEAKGQYLLPGCIDDHVHFRDPGLTHKADMYTESHAAARGGVTSVMDMPNCTPQTTTIEALEAKFTDAKEKCLVNHSFYLGATSDNMEEIRRIDPTRVCGLKVFMGSSTGNMLVAEEERLVAIFSESPTLIALHCEDQGVIAANTAKYKAETNSDDPDVTYHPLVRSEEACYRSTAKAVELAQRTGARIHVMHISTARELELLTTGDITDPTQQPDKTPDAAQKAENSSSWIIWALCGGIARGILESRQDAEECVNDTYLTVWNKIPPTRPNNFTAFICKITRNLSLKKLETSNAMKRSADAIISLSEIETTLPDYSIAQGVEDEELAKLISAFLWSEKELDRNVFLRKYWFFDTISDIAERYSMRENTVKSMLFRSRNRLREFLKKEGIEV